MAFQQLASNKLRSFLSLLGITIGIWSIISVLSAVDSLEMNIRGSFDKLGDDVVYLDKFIWGQNPGSTYWKWVRYPEPSYDDYEAIKANVKSADITSYAAVVGSKTVEYKSNNVENVFFLAITYDFSEMYNFDFSKGRYFTRGEHQTGVNQVVIGAVAAEKLFGNIDPVGKRIKVSGRKYTVIGVLEKEGNSILSVMNFDEVVMIPVPTAQKFMNVKRSRNTLVNAKASNGYSMDQLEGEVTAAVRGNRRLKPKQESNFVLNKLSILSNVFDDLFGVISTVGWVIGGFAILVGGFGVANIMFVSVKERTNIIGIKKALGAKRYVILMEFLIESIILCFIGGVMGLLMVYGMVQLGNIVTAGEFEFTLTAQNVIIGAGLSMIIGVIAGFLPALQAAKMNPVDAIRA